MLMIEKIGEPAMLEQLAEEASELSQAALKKARVLRQENPTDKTLPEADKNLREEYTDVVQCANELLLAVDPEQMQRKQIRFRKRWRQSHGEKRTDV